MVHRYSRHHRGGFFSQAHHAINSGVQGMDGFVRRFGPQAKNFAMMVSPMLAKAGQPGLAAGLAAGAQAMDSYASLRNQLD